MNKKLPLFRFLFLIEYLYGNFVFSFATEFITIKEASLPSFVGPGYTFPRISTDGNGHIYVLASGKSAYNTTVILRLNSDLKLLQSIALPIPKTQEIEDICAYESHAVIAETGKKLLVVDSAGNLIAHSFTAPKECISITCNKSDLFVLAGIPKSGVFSRNFNKCTDDPAWVFELVLKQQLVNAKTFQVSSVHPTLSSHIIICNKRFIRLCQETYDSPIDNSNEAFIIHYSNQYAILDQSLDNGTIYKKDINCDSMFATDIALDPIDSGFIVCLVHSGIKKGSFVDAFDKNLEFRHRSKPYNAWINSISALEKSRFAAICYGYINGSDKKEHILRVVKLKEDP